MQGRIQGDLWRLEGHDAGAYSGGGGARNAKMLLIFQNICIIITRSGHTFLLVGMVGSFRPTRQIPLQSI